MNPTTLNITNAFDRLVQIWNLYSAKYDTNSLMSGIGICLGLTSMHEGHFTDEEVEFVNMYIDECSNVFRDVPEDNYGY